MTVLIISSTEDPASTNIKESLLEQTNWEEKDSWYGNIFYRHTNMKNIILMTINDRLIFRENLDSEIEDFLGLNLKQIIFLSRHSSSTGQPTLTTHPIGNYGEALYGGKTKTLVPSSPRLMTHLLKILIKKTKQNKLYHKVCFEVTHHGPYLETPTLFIEVGSDENEWKKKHPAETIAQSLIELFKKYHYEDDLPTDIPILIGIGGGHYAPRFTDIIIEKKAAFGHMIPTYQIQANNIDEQVLEKTIEATPNLYGIYLHKKSIKKSQITEFKKFFDKKGILVISSKELSDSEEIID